MAEQIRRRAPAKLNLALSVGDPDSSGMHPIASWMVTIDLVDDLTLARLEDDRLSRYAVLWHKDAKRRSDISWSIRDDLAVRAHLALERHVGRRLPVQMKLEKRIPVGGGLGGGSSNAAAMLRATNDLFSLGLEDTALAEIAHTLGSDVPFFLRGGSALVEGLGETLEHHETVLEMHAVVAFPDFPCPTGAVYRAFDELRNAAGVSGDAAASAVDAARVRRLAGVLSPETPFNDLAEAALRVEPRLVEHLDALASLAERPAHVAGSGSSIFVICDDPIHAEALAAAVESKLHLPAVATRTIG